MVGVPLTAEERNLLLAASQKVTKKTISSKIKVLLDFGFKKDEIVSLFADREFASLRALDCFADNLIREKLKNIG